MSEQVGSVTRKKSSDFHGGIRFQSSFTIRWELEDKNFLKIDIIDSLKYRIMAIKTNENFIPFSNSVVTASELIPGFCRWKSNVPTPGSLRTIKSPTGGIVSGIKSPPLARTPPFHGIYIDRCINPRTYKGWGGVVGCPPEVFLIFLDDKTSIPDVFSSCSFIPRTQFETSLLMVSYYGYDTWRHK